MKKKTHALAILLIVLMASCSLRKSDYARLSASDKKVADSLIKSALENEGLFTITGRLKPISSVRTLGLKIMNDDTTNTKNWTSFDTTSADLKKLQQYQHIVNSLHFGDLNFMMNPYDMHLGARRILQITIYRKSLMDSLVRAKQAFYAQFGIAAGSKPELVVSTTEYEERLNRLRSYGYMFGYPDHAVDFFIDAAKSSDQTGKHVERDFFQIPVYSSNVGHFVYAIPKGTKPRTVDSVIYKKAAVQLANYKKERKKFERKDSSVNYYKLLRKLIRNDER